MIKLTDKIDAPEAPNAELLKIRLTFDAYSDVALFWRQEESGCTISMLDMNVVIYAPSGTDFEELAQFITVISPCSVFTSLEAAQKLGLSPLKRAAVMVSDNPFGSDAPTLMPSSERLYKLLLAGGFDLPEYPQFAVDICHRVNHGFAKVATVGECAAAVAFHTDRYFLINGIVSLEKGQGSRVLRKICSMESGKTAIACCEEALCGFYEKNTFTHLYDTVYWEAE